MRFRVQFSYQHIGLNMKISQIQFNKKKKKRNSLDLKIYSTFASRLKAKEPVSRRMHNHTSDHSLPEIVRFQGVRGKSRRWQECASGLRIGQRVKRRSVLASVCDHGP